MKTKLADVIREMEDHEDVEQELSPAVVEKLSQEQVYDVLRLKYQKEDPDSLNLVSLLVPLGLFAMVLGIVALVLHRAHRQEQLRAENIRVCVEKGVPIPPELLVSAEPKSDLRRGIVLLTTGVGIALTLAGLDRDLRNTAIGAIPAVIGLGYLVVWRLEKPKTPSAR
ncbi:MAG: DUF6249 domain-containing protein [Myxococcaceae bacterium]